MLLTYTCENFKKSTFGDTKSQETLKIDEQRNSTKRGEIPTEKRIRIRTYYMCEEIN